VSLSSDGDGEEVLMPRKPPPTLTPVPASSVLKYRIERAQGAEELTALGISVREGVLLAWDLRGTIRILAPGQWEGVRVVDEPTTEAPPA